MNYCVYNSQTDEARHTSNKQLAHELFGRIKSGYMSEIDNDKETVVCRK